MKVFLVALCFILFFPLLGASFDEKMARKVFESKCSICHPIEWALERKKTKNGWKETVDRMRKKTAGNLISEEDSVIIVEYLYKIRGK